MFFLKFNSNQPKSHHNWNNILQGGRQVFGFLELFLNRLVTASVKTYHNLQLSCPYPEQKLFTYLFEKGQNLHPFTQASES